MSSTSACLRVAVEIAGQVADACRQACEGRHQSSSTRPRIFFTVERPDLGLQPPLDGAFGRPGLLARRRRRLGGLGDEFGKPGAGVGAVLLLRAEAPGLDDDDAVLGGALAGEFYDARTDALRQAFGGSRVEA